MTKEEKNKLLKQAWTEVFETENVSDDADFFEEGGDSIKAVQLSSWLVQKGLKLDLGKIFYTPVLSQMAEAVEETDPVYVPDQLLTKDIMKEKYLELMRGDIPAEPAPAAQKDAEPAAGSQQICDPKANQAASQQICDPKANQAASQQICDPKANQAASQQICDPKANQAASQQICDPKANQAASQQICDPAAGTGFFAPMPAQDTTYLLLQMMISQQQSMLYMMQLMLQMQLSRNPTAPFKFTFPKMPGKPDPQNMPPEKKAAMEKVMESYRSKKVDHPIEKPNVIGIQKAKVIKPEKSAEEVLEHVLSGLLPNGYSKEKDLFEQGLTSLDTVKMVTRCGEHGYRLSMQDIYMHSTFEGLIACMKPGE